MNDKIINCIDLCFNEYLLLLHRCIYIYIFHWSAKVPEDLNLGNRTVYTVISIPERSHLTEDMNPAPGVCLPIIVTFCQQHNVTMPYFYLNVHLWEIRSKKKKSHYLVPETLYSLVRREMNNVYLLAIIYTMLFTRRDIWLILCSFKKDFK